MNIGEVYLDFVLVNIHQYPGRPQRIILNISDSSCGPSSLNDPHLIELLSVTSIIFKFHF
jgi:hypothetical protein